MRMRATLDRLISIGGLILAVVLLVAGGLLVWANVFIGNEVHDQLAAQKVTMPTDQTGLATLPAADKAVLEPYAGQLMTTGKQAKAYADHYIAVHLNEVAGGKTYSEVSGAYLAQCSDPTAAKSAACQTLSTQRQPCSRARLSVACSCTATPSPRWARSPDTPPSPRSSALPCSWSSPCSGSGTLDAIPNWKPAPAPTRLDAPASAHALPTLTGLQSPQGQGIDPRLPAPPGHPARILAFWAANSASVSTPAALSPPSFFNSSSGSYALGSAGGAGAY